MATFVLVHGAWLGGWIWRDVESSLREAGHQDHTPTLTGLGEREHLGTPAVDLETHVTDVVNVLDDETLEDVTMVGHSYAGLVVTGVLERAADRIASVVYLDAMVPREETPTSFYDLGDEAYRETIESEASEGGSDWRWPMPEAPGGFEGISDADAAWIREKAVGHPIGTFEQPVDDMNPIERGIETTYVLCTLNGMAAADLESVRETVRARDWELVEFETGHWPMVSIPGELVDLLESHVRGLS